MSTNLMGGNQPLKYPEDPIDTSPQDDCVEVFPRTPKNGVDVEVTLPPDHFDADSRYNGDLTYTGSDSQATSAPLNKVRLIVPLHDNKGVPIEPSWLDSFERNLAAIAGGWSDLGTIRGGFIMPDGSLCIDWNQVYEVAMPSRGDGQKLISLLHDIGGRMGQHSICYEDDPIPKVFIERVKSKITTPILEEES